MIIITRLFFSLRTTINRFPMKFSISIKNDLCECIIDYKHSSQGTCQHLSMHFLRTCTICYFTTVWSGAALPRSQWHCRCQAINNQSLVYHKNDHLTLRARWGVIDAVEGWSRTCRKRKRKRKKEEEDCSTKYLWCHRGPNWSTITILV